jgi:hypothetical protein
LTLPSYSPPFSRSPRSSRSQRSSPRYFTPSTTFTTSIPFTIHLLSFRVLTPYNRNSLNSLRSQSAPVPFCPLPFPYLFFRPLPLSTPTALPSPSRTACLLSFPSSSSPDCRRGSAAASLALRLVRSPASRLVDWPSPDL